MDTQKLTDLAQGATKQLVKHSPKVLTGLGIAGMFTTVLFAVKASKKAELLIDEAKALKADEDGTPQEDRDKIKLTPLETVKAITPAYWPTAAMFILSTAAIISSDYISDKRQAALSAAYTIADISLKEFQKKTTETLGEKKADEIRAKVTEEKFKKANISPETKQFAIDNQHLTFFMAPMTGQPFMARIEDVKEVFTRLNNRVNNYEEVMLNDLLYELNAIAKELPSGGRGVHENDVGSIFFWEAGGELINYHFSAAMVPDTEIPGLEIILDTEPKCCYDMKKVVAC